MAAPRLRRATAADVPALAALYANTARHLGPSCYAPEQVEAWAHFGADTPAFRDYVLNADTWLAEDGRGALLGFCGVSDSGEVHSLYVRSDLTRQGLGSRLLADALQRGAARGITHFQAWATPFSRPVFLRAGFVLAQVVQAEFEGVMFERYRVERSAVPG